MVSRTGLDALSPQFSAHTLENRTLLCGFSGSLRVPFNRYICEVYHVGVGFFGLLFDPFSGLLMQLRIVFFIIHEKPD